ncbi:MAG: MFS transporter [Streptococcus sp.]|nr:MFS transporter [Streptococcus sp.]
MKKFMEKISVLSLSLLLTTAFSISSIQSSLFTFYKDIPNSWVELLISLPSAGIMLTLLLNRVIEHYLTERQMIITGLFLFSLCAFVPLLNPSYWIIFLSRLLFGIGVGLLNAKAISIISERYEGKERVQMLGLRGSAEVVGSATLTFGVGQLLQYGWQSTFLVYSFGLVVLFLYLLFVPYERVEKKSIHQVEKLEKQQWRNVLFFSFVAAIIVLTYVVLNIYVPVVLEQEKMGTAKTAATILAMTQLIGILAGISFANLIQFFRGRLLLLSTLSFGIVQILIGWSPNVLIFSIFTIVSGFVYTISLTTIFHLLSEQISRKTLNQATSFVIVGCSVGATSSTFILDLLKSISNHSNFIFTIFGIMMGLTGLTTLAFIKKVEKIG